jgi:hypothetical protein
VAKSYTCPVPGCGRVSQRAERISEHYRMIHKQRDLERCRRLKAILERHMAAGAARDGR